MSENFSELSRLSPATRNVSLLRGGFWPFAFGAASNLLVLAGPVFALQVFDRVLTSRSVETLVFLIMLMAVMLAGAGVFDLLRRRIITRQTEALVDRLVSVPTREAWRAELITHHAQNIGHALSGPGFISVIDLPWSLVFACLLFIIHPGLALVGGVAFVVALVPVFAMSQQGRAYLAWWVSPERQKTETEPIAAFGGWTVFRFAWRSKRRNDFLAALPHLDAVARHRTVQTYGGLLAQSMMIAVGAWLVIMDQLSPGAIIASTVLLSRMLAPLAGVAAGYEKLKSGAASWRALSDMSANMRETASLSSGKMLRVTNLTAIAHTTARPALRALNFELASGQVMGVLGTGGAGKTALCKVIVGAWRPAGGTIDWPATDLADDQRLLGYLPQVTDLSSGSLAANVTGLESGYDRSALDEALALSGLSARPVLVDADGRPMGENGRDLPFSDVRKILLARAIYRRPKLLVLDDPFAGLGKADEDTIPRILDAFRGFGAMVILTAHPSAALPQLDLVLRLDRGRQVFAGEQMSRRTDPIASISQPMSSPYG